MAFLERVIVSWPISAIAWIGRSPATDADSALICLDILIISVFSGAEQSCRQVDDQMSGGVSLVSVMSSDLTYFQCIKELHKLNASSTRHGADLL